MNVDEINTFLAAWTAAEQSGDTIALEHQLADDFVGVGPLGFMLSRQDWLERLASGALKYDTFRLDETLVRGYGDAAVVTARQTGEGTYQGHPIPGVVRGSLTLVNQSGAWRLAGIHMSFIAGTPGAPPHPGTTRPSGRGGPVTRHIRAFLLVEAATFVAAALVHAGLGIVGYEHPEARTAESVIAVVLLAALALSWARPAWSRGAGLAAQGFALLGTLIGLFTIAIGVGPRTVPDVVYHIAIVAVLVWGLVVAARAPSSAHSKGRSQT